MKPRIYLDHNASTSIDPLVIEAIIKELNEEEGNPSSIHFHGKKAKRRLEEAREKIARFLHVKSNEIIFTSGGTEGANALLEGLFFDAHKGHIISSAAEHACVYETLLRLQKFGCDVEFLMPGLWGAVTPEAVKKALRTDTKAICLMAVNNETGVKTDIEAIAHIAKEANISFIVDGVALLGKEQFSIPTGVSALFFTGHKIHAPKGIGFMFCRSSCKLNSFIIGGNQEYNRRAGTENLSGIVGLGVAVDLLRESQNQFSHHMQHLRDRFEKLLQDSLEAIVINGQGPRICNVSNISFLGVDGEALLIHLDMIGLSVSHGSACSSGGLEPSRILLKMGLSTAEASSAIRFSLSRFTTENEIDQAVKLVVEAVNKLRG